ncbi:MAG: hypothetical protein H6747_12485 [Deltaproteobacteria bacterium]|nr:hypothetical protein [Deltaproteobacteria bacterium]
MMATTDALTSSELESNLWEAANIVPGNPLDRTDRNLSIGEVLRRDGWLA